MITLEESVRLCSQVEEAIARKLSRRYRQRSLSVIARPAVGTSSIRAVVILVTQDRIIELASACTPAIQTEDAADRLYKRMIPLVSENLRHYQV